MSISIYITEDISRTSTITLRPEYDQDFMDKHESLIVQACAGDKQAAMKLYELAIEEGFDPDDYDTTGADVTDVEVEEEAE